MKTIESIMTAMDSWVVEHGNGTYVADDFNFQPEAGDHAIQQNRKELRDFVEVLLGLPQRRTILEIGLGNHGGTHFLWRMLFELVITIDNNIDLIERFKHKHHLDDKSMFIFGDSGSEATVTEVTALATSVDTLFIDGEHSFDGVRKDWFNYHNLVCRAGIIAFHDSCNPGAGIGRFVSQLSSGEIDGSKHTLQTIMHCPVVGLTYERQS